MIAKLEWTQRNTQQNIEPLHNPTLVKESKTNQEQQNHRLRTDSSLSHLGAKIHFTDIKSSP